MNSAASILQLPWDDVISTCLVIFIIGITLGLSIGFSVLFIGLAKWTAESWFGMGKEQKQLVNTLLKMLADSDDDKIKGNFNFLG